MGEGEFGSGIFIAEKYHTKVYIFEAPLETSNAPREVSIYSRHIFLSHLFSSWVPFNFLDPNLNSESRSGSTAETLAKM
jgi:hypothetical protein